MTSTKALLKDCLPPVMTRWVQSLRSGRIRFEGDFASQMEAHAHATGYDAGSILAQVLDATLKVKLGEAEFERDSALFFEPEYEWPVLAGLLDVAARNKGCLNVLDFGGALGSSYFQHKRFLNGLPSLRWNVVEQQHFVETGKVHIQDEALSFYSSIDACLVEQQPNAVLLSSVLQYLENPESIVKSLKGALPSTIILDRTIVNDTTSTRHYVQHVPRAIYPASYACSSLSERQLIKWFLPEYQLIASFPSLDFPALASIHSAFKGFLFGRAR